MLIAHLLAAVLATEPCVGSVARADATAERVEDYRRAGEAVPDAVASAAEVARAALDACRALATAERAEAQREGHHRADAGTPAQQTNAQGDMGLKPWGGEEGADCAEQRQRAEQLGGQARAESVHELWVCKRRIRYSLPGLTQTETAMDMGEGPCGSELLEATSAEDLLENHLLRLEPVPPQDDQREAVAVEKLRSCAAEQLAREADIRAGQEAERQREVKHKASLVPKNEKDARDRQRTLASALLCADKALRNDSLTVIKTELRYAKEGGGMVDKEKLHDMQDWMRQSDEHAREIREWLSAHKLQPLGCGLAPVKRIWSCLGYQEVDDAVSWQATADCSDEAASTIITDGLQ